MPEIATLARPYAEALFRVAQASNLAAWSELVSEMAAVAALPDVKAFASNPTFTDAQVAETFYALLKSKLFPEAKSFVRMLVENGRLLLLPEIGRQFHVLKNAAQGVADAVITSAFALEDGQLTDLVTILEKRFGRKLNPTVSVDSALIGGVRVTVGDEVLDTSVRAKLQRMYIALAS